MITSLVRLAGILSIVLFCAISVFFALAQRDLSPIDEQLNKITSYPSFFEDRFYDMRMKWTMNDEVKSNKVTFVTIDDATLETFGRWPLTRNLYVEVLKKLGQFNAKVVGFDIFFPEPENSCGESKPDINFSKEIERFQKNGGHVLMSYNLSLLSGEYKTDREFDEFPMELTNSMISSKVVGGKSLLEFSVSKNTWPIQPIMDANPALGHIESFEDADGIFRHYFLTVNVEDLYFPSFALSAYQLFTGDSPQLQRNYTGETFLKLKNGDVGLNHNGQAKIRWYGNRWNFDEMSIKELLESKTDDLSFRKKIEDRIVIIGATAFGLGDIRHSPIDAKLPGPLFHINMIQMLLDGKFLRPIETSTFLSWWILFGGTLVIVLIQLLGKPILDIFVTGGIALGLFLTDVYYLTPHGYEIKLFFCLLSIIACYSWNTFLNFYLSNKDRQFLKSAFENYISPELIEEMYEKGEQPALGGDKDILTAYFTDIESFSTFSEQLNAEELVVLLNEYLTAMTDILLEERGTLDKYEGDAIIAFFGAPSKFSDHAQRAMRVAAIMQMRLNDLRQEWKNSEKNWPDIVRNMRMRIGINSGEIVTGNMGSTQRMNYTMMGDAVNLAARLEEAAKQYGIYAHFSKNTLDLLDYPEEFIFRELDTIQVVGKKEPIVTYELLGLNLEPSEELLNLISTFTEGVKLYRSKEWEKALKKFRESEKLETFRFQDETPTKTNPSEVYIKRCEDYLENPPPQDWDGVYRLTKK